MMIFYHCEHDINEMSKCSKNSSHYLNGTIRFDVMTEDPRSGISEEMRVSTTIPQVHQPSKNNEN